MLHVTDSPGADALGIRLADGAKSAETVHLTDDCAVDLDAQGRVIYVEILRAAAQYPRRRSSSSAAPTSSSRWPRRRARAASPSAPSRRRSTGGSCPGPSEDGAGS